MLQLNEDGTDVRIQPAWAYNTKLRIESVTKIAPTKVSDGNPSVWAYREANAVVLVVPGRRGSTSIAAGQGTNECSMATMVLSTAPECKTTAGCGRFGRITSSKFSLTAGVSDNALAVRLMASK
jgi:hypothetical protein